MEELAELSAETRDIALSRFRLLEPHLEEHRSSQQTREFPFERRNCFWLLRQIASKHLRHIEPQSTLCAIAEIANEHTDRNTTAYLQSWIAKLEEDNRLIVHAAANAQRAVDSIIGTTFEDEARGSEETEEEAAAGASVDSYSSAA
jgi:hypothetical protein